MKLRFLLVLVSLAVASAGTLDFSGLAIGSHGSPIVLPEATLTSLTGTFVSGAAGISHEICAISSGSCQADIDIVFNFDISALTLVTSGYQPGDVVDFYVYDAVNNLIGSALDHTGDAAVLGLAGFSGVRRLYIDDRSSSAGFGYDQFEFDAGQVPEPATWGLLALGFAGLGILRRRS